MLQTNVFKLNNAQLRYFGIAVCAFPLPVALR